MTDQQVLVADRVVIGNVCCDAVGYQEALDRIAAYVRGDRAHLVLTPNIAQVRQASRLPSVANAYTKVSMSTPDGWPIVMALRLLGAKGVRGRVTGSDLTPLLCRQNYRVSIVGGKGDSAMRAAAALSAANPGLDVALVEPATPQEIASDPMRTKMIDRIVGSNSDLIFLGVGVPKQELLALELLNKLERGVVLCVGATIEFLAGTTARSPRWMQVLGIEWLYRLGIEPRRMFKRYYKAAPYFAWQLLKAMIDNRSVDTRALKADEIRE